MKKKIFGVLLIAMLFIVGTSAVNAAAPIITQQSGCYEKEVRPVITVDKVYVSGGPAYAIGDLVDIEVGPGIHKDFYVLVASSEVETSVTAILKGFLGAPSTYHSTSFGFPDEPGSVCKQPTEVDYDTSYIKTVVDARTSAWTNVDSVGLITIEQIETLLGTVIVDPTQVITFNFNVNLPINAPGEYWTASHASYQHAPAPSDCDVWFVGGNGNPGTPSTPGVTNPQTGIASPLILGGIAVVGVVGIIVVLRKKNYFAKI